MLELCPVAEIAYGKEQELPCPALIFDGNKALCNMVITEKQLNSTMIANALGIGCGCSMPDRETTADQINDFDAQSRSKVYES